MFKAPIKPITEFRQIPAEIFGAYTIVHTTDIAFHVRDHGMNPRQHLYGVLSGCHDHRMMDALGTVQNAIGTPAITAGDHSFLEPTSADALARFINRTPACNFDNLFVPRRSG